MTKTSRLILLTGIFLLISACAPAQPRPPVEVSMIPPSPTAQPTSTGITATGTALTPIIPITGENVVEMQCQFCVNDLAHAVFIFPDYAIFDVENSSPVTCTTAEVINGQRVLVCYGEQQMTFNLKICSDSSNCLLYPVALQSCPVIPNTGAAATTATPITPVFLTAINTLRPPASTQGPLPAGASQTPSPAFIPPTTTGVVTLPPIVTTVVPPGVTPEPPQPTATQPPAPTSPPRDTNTPRPTQEPHPTHEPRPTHEAKDTNTPRP